MSRLQRRLRSLLLGGAGGAAPAADLGLLLLRLYFGLGLALAHGLNKLPPSERFLAGVEEMGFPFPVFFGWTSGVVEFGGGILLALGLATRPAAFLIVINMLVATFIRQAGDPFGERELALAYLLAAVALLLTGAGRYSLDALLTGAGRRGRPGPPAGDRRARS